MVIDHRAELATHTHPMPPLRDLEKVLYFEAHIVIEPGETDLKVGELLNDDALAEAREQYGRDAFQVGIGAEAIPT